MVAERTDRHWRHWTEEETRRLVDATDRYVPVTTLAKRLGRTVEAVEARRIRVACDSYQDRSWTRNRLIELFGVGEVRVHAWVAAGFFRIRRPGEQQVRRLIDSEDLLAFLADPTFWHEWDAEALTARWLRELAIEQRGGERWLSVEEAAQCLAVSPGAVYWRVAQGRMQARRRIDGSLRFRAEWVEEARSFRTRAYHKRPWTAEEIDVLVTWRPLYTIADIALVVGRDVGTVRNKCRVLGLTGPMVPHRERQQHGRPRGKS